MFGCQLLSERLLPLLVRPESPLGLQEPAEMVFWQSCKVVQVPQGFSGKMAQASLEVDQNSRWVQGMLDTVIICSFEG